MANLFYIPLDQSSVVQLYIEKYVCHIASRLLEILFWLKWINKEDNHFLLHDALFCPWIAKCLLYQESKILEYTSFWYKSIHILLWFLNKKVLCESFSTETDCST